jgi:hypothetical protein
MTRPPDPLGKRALFWAPGERIEEGPFDPRAPVPGKRALFSRPEPEGGPLTIECSSCRTSTDVSYVDFIRRHVPLWLWVPGRRYSRLLACPACGRRTWVRVTWRPAFR